MWLEAICDHVAMSVEITPDDFDATPFAERGGLGAAARAFGGQIAPLLRELRARNETTWSKCHLRRRIVAGQIV